jgi:hypothetical protein
VKAKTITIGIVVLMAALLLSGAALAGDNDTANCTYNPTECDVVVKGSNTTTSPAAVKSDDLPFTGVDVTLLVGGGALLGLLGFAMHRAGRDDRS